MAEPIIKVRDLHKYFGALHVIKGVDLDVAPGDRVGPGAGLIESGSIAGVLDVTTTEWADQLVGGVLAAGPDRLDAAAKRGITIPGNRVVGVYRNDYAVRALAARREAHNQPQEPPLVAAEQRAMERRLRQRPAVAQSAI